MNIRIYIYIYTYEKANFTDVVAKHIYIISNSSTKLFHKSGLECDHASSEGLGAGHDNALRFLKPFFEVIHSLNPKWNLQIGISKMVLLPNVGMFGFHVEIRRCSWGWKGPKYLNTSKRIIYHMYIYIYIQISTPKIISRNQGGPIQIAPESWYKAQLVETRHVNWGTFVSPKYDQAVEHT